MIKYTDMLKEVYLYELANNIPEDVRMVTYIPEICMYQPNVTNDEIRSRYYKIIKDREETERRLREAKENIGEYSGSAKEKTDEVSMPDMAEAEPVPETVTVQRTLNLKDSKVIVAKFLNGHTDRATYSYKNIKNAMDSYLSIGCDKAIGYTYEGRDYYVLRKSMHVQYSEPVDAEEEQEFFYNYYAELLCDTVRQREELRIKEETEAEEAKRREEELRINPKFKKDFIKILKQSRDKLIRGKNFEAYDFRGMELKDIVFLDCNFNFANFTDINVINVIFIRCSMEDVIQDGTGYNNTDMIQCRRNKNNK